MEDPIFITTSKTTTVKILSTIFFFLAVFHVQAQPGNSESLAKEGLKVLGQEFGTLTYSVTSGGEGEVVYKFDRFGLLTSTIQNFRYTLYGIETEMNENIIRDGEYIFIYDLNRKTGRKKKNKTEIDLLKYKSIEETRQAIYSIYGGQMIGKETILDKETEHWKFESGPIKEAWYWQGIILKASIKKPQVSYTYEATSIDLNKPNISYPDITVSEK
jgi:hypothetical protein